MIPTWHVSFRNVKSDENVRLCMGVFNCDDVDTMLMKQRLKFFDGQIVVPCHATVIRLVIIFIIIFCFVLLSYYFLCCIVVSMTK